MGMPPPAEEASVAQQLAALYEPISEHLNRVERALRRELASEIDFVAELTSRVQLYQGKRLRPALVLLTAEACGGVRPEHHVLGAVVEMIHAATLVHDDVLDDADLRRHVTTVNAEWGNEASVLLGDYLFTHAFHLAASLESASACRIIGRATNKVCEGELHQVARRSCFELSEEEYIAIVTGKTAELIACCCRLGARYAGADAGTEEAMTGYGLDLGIAFQITDDLLDLLGERAQTGKPAGSDLENQKLTLPLIRFRQTAKASEIEACREIFEQSGPQQREAILAYLRDSDSIAYTRARGRQFAESASRRLDGLPAHFASHALRSLASFVVERIA